MIRTYIFNKNSLEGLNYSPELFSQRRRDKIAKIKREEAVAMANCAELLLIYGLRQQNPEIPVPLDITESDRQKPQLAGNPYYFNLSHSGDYAACSVSDSPVGVDIECFRVRDLMSPDRILHPEEAHLLAYISNPNEKKKYFYQCWVAKESYLKNLGIGLIVRPRDFAVNEDSLKIMDQDFTQIKGHHSLQIKEPEKAKEGDNTLNENLNYLEKRYVHVLEPGEIRGTDWKFDAGYKVAVCSMEKDPDSIARLVTADMMQEMLDQIR